MTAEEIVAQLPVLIGECAIIPSYVGGPYEVRVDHIDDAYNTVYCQRFSAWEDALRLTNQLRDLRAIMDHLTR